MRSYVLYYGETDRLLSPSHYAQQVAAKHLIVFTQTINRTNWSLTVQKHYSNISQTFYCAVCLHSVLFLVIQLCLLHSSLGSAEAVMKCYPSHQRSATGNYHGCHLQPAAKPPLLSLSLHVCLVYSLCLSGFGDMCICAFLFSSCVCACVWLAEQCKLISVWSQQGISRVSCSTGCSENSMPTTNTAGLCWVWGQYSTETLRHEDHKESLGSDSLQLSAASFEHQG